MTPQRIAVKFFVAADVDSGVELEPCIGLFHRFIQEGSLAGLLIDVADYSHVPDGPGVLLVGHDVDYALDEQGGRRGLLVVRKRFGDQPLADVLRDALGRALAAVRAIEQDGSTGLRFDTGAVEVQLVDRLAAPNTDAAWEAVRKDVEGAARALFGDAAIQRCHDGDARRTLAFAVRAAAPASAAELLDRIGHRAPAAELLDRIGHRAPAAQSADTQSQWDISVEDLKALRDGGDDFALVDVREPREREICDVGGELIPLGGLAQRLGELDSNAHTVVYCRSGNRSAKAVELLRGAGFSNVWNVNGGILAWIDRIDPSLTRY